MIEEKPEIVSKVSLLFGKIYPIVFFALSCFGFYESFIVYKRNDLFTCLVPMAMAAAFFLFTRWYSLSVYKDRLVVKYLLGPKTVIQLNEIVSWKEIGWTYPRKLTLCTKDDDDDFSINSGMFANYNEIKAKLTKDKTGHTTFF